MAGCGEAEAAEAADVLARMGSVLGDSTPASPSFAAELASSGPCARRAFCDLCRACGGVDASRAASLESCPDAASFDSAAASFCSERSLSWTPSFSDRAEAFEWLIARAQAGRARQGSEVAAAERAVRQIARDVRAPVGADACAVLRAAAARALSSQLLPLGPRLLPRGELSGALSGAADSLGAQMSADHAVRRAMLLTRARVCLQALAWSERARERAGELQAAVDESGVLCDGAGASPVYGALETAAACAELAAHTRAAVAGTRRTAARQGRLKRPREDQSEQGAAAVCPAAPQPMQVDTRPASDTGGERT